MTVFISHSSRDGDALTNLVEHLQAADESVWLDKKLSGGQAWWDEILSQIRSSSVFVFALSNNSRSSKPCQAELAYARALGLPILPVQIGDTDRFLIDPLFTNIVDYRTPDAQNSIKLVTALRAKATERAELTEPLPEPPPVPYEYLQRLGVAIDSSDPLPHTEQSRIVMELRSSLGSEAEPTVVNDIRHLLRDLRRRPDATFTTVKEVDDLLAQTEAPATAELPPALPPADHSTSVIPQPTTPITPSSLAYSQPELPTPGSAPYAPPSQPSMQAWGAPPPPPPSSGGSGKWIAIGAGAIALIAIAAVVIWLAVRPEPAKPIASNSSSSSSTSTSSSTSPTGTSTTTTSTQGTGSEAQLRGLLPQGYSEDTCPLSDKPLPGSLISVDCKANTKPGGPTQAGYALYEDQAGLDEMFKSVVGLEGAELLTCPGIQEQSPTTWHLKDTPQAAEGQLACMHYKDLYTVTWTYNSKNLLAIADGTDINALYEWWQKYT